LREFPAELPVVVAAPSAAEAASAAPRRTDEQLKEAILGLEASSIDLGATVPALADDIFEKAKLPRTETNVAIVTLLHSKLEQNGKLSQNAAFEEIVRPQYPQELRATTRAIVKALKNNTKPAPEIVEKD
jgi:hypothetical protein